MNTPYTIAVTYHAKPGRRENFLRQLSAEGVIDTIDYGAQILIRASLPQERTQTLTQRLRELSAGSVAVRQLSKTYRAAPVKK